MNKLAKGIARVVAYSLIGISLLGGATIVTERGLARFREYKSNSIRAKMEQNEREFEMQFIPVERYTGTNNSFFVRVDLYEPFKGPPRTEVTLSPLNAKKQEDITSITGVKYNGPWSEIRVASDRFFDNSQTFTFGKDGRYVKTYGDEDLKLSEAIEARNSLDSALLAIMNQEHRIKFDRTALR